MVQTCLLVAHCLVSICALNNPGAGISYLMMIDDHSNINAFMIPATLEVITPPLQCRAFLPVSVCCRVWCHESVPDRGFPPVSVCCCSTEEGHPAGGQREQWLMWVRLLYDEPSISTLTTEMTEQLLTTLHLNLRFNENLIKIEIECRRSAQR